MSQNKKRPKSRTELREKLTHDPMREYKTQRFNYFGEVFVQNLPLWRLYTARMMLTSDPIINFSHNIRNAALMAGKVKVTAKRPEVAAWVQKQWDFLWNNCRRPLVSAKRWGFAALQVLYKVDSKGLTQVRGLRDFAPEDARAVERRGSICGLRVKAETMYFPQALWLSFGAEFGSAYGIALTRRQYPPWYEKWMERGAKRLQQLRMIKDAYIGDIFWYPPDINIEMPDGTVLPWKDVMREIGENRLSGGALTLPMKLDSNGKELTRYTPPQAVAGVSDIFNWVESCDNDILKGADVPLEVVEAANTGSGFSGRSIPFLVLLSVCTEEFVDIVQQVDKYCLRMGAWLNFGGDPEYQIEPQSLVDTFSGSIAGTPMAGGSIGGTNPEQQQGDQGTPQAVTQQYSENEKLSCLLATLPIELSLPVRRLSLLIDHADLHEKGREQDPHVTVKYGLHSQDPEEVYEVVRTLPPVAIQVGPCSCFKNEEYDVVKLEIVSEGLRRLNDQVCDMLEHTDTYAEYEPHVTLAYVKSGRGDYWAKRLNLLEGRAAALDSVIFSDNNRVKTPMRLQGPAQFAEDATAVDDARDYASRLRGAIQKVAVVPDSVTSRVKTMTNVLRAFKGDDLQDFIQLVDAQLEALRSFLGAELAADSMPSAVRGLLEVFSRLPETPMTRGVSLTKTPYGGISTSGLRRFLASSETVHDESWRMPELEAAVQKIKSSPVAAGHDFVQTAEKVRQGAFAVTGDYDTNTISKVRDAYVKTLHEGRPQQDFVEEATKIVEDRMSPARLATVFRTNAMAAYSDAKYDAVMSPMVADAFPYASYFATQDARVRPHHAEMERAGLDGTNVYRTDDPTFVTFRPPWDYQCRCRWSPVSVEQAARKGVKEAQEWLERARTLAVDLGGTFYQYLEQAAPSTSQHVTPPSFEPTTGFERE